MISSSQMWKVVRGTSRPRNVSSAAPSTVSTTDVTAGRRRRRRTRQSRPPTTPPPTTTFSLSSDLPETKSWVHFVLEFWSEIMGEVKGLRKLFGVGPAGQKNFKHFSSDLWKSRVAPIFFFGKMPFFSKKVKKFDDSPGEKWFQFTKKKLHYPTPVFSTFLVTQTDCVGEESWSSG